MHDDRRRGQPAIARPKDMVTLSQLEAFVETCRQGSYTRAAERLFISQPALHHKVKQLEARLGATLLTVRNRQVVPTSAGTIVLEHAQRVLAAATALEVAVQQLGDDQSIRIGATSVLIAGALSTALERFEIEHPGMSVLVRAIDFDEVFDALLSGDVEFVSTYADYVPTDLHVEPLRPSRLVCVAARTHPLADGQVHQLEELLEYPIALTYKGMSLRTKIERWFRDEANIDDLVVRFEAKTTALLAMMLPTLPTCVTFMPEPTRHQFELSEILLDASPLYTDPVVCWLPGRALRRPTMELLDVYRAVAESCSAECSNEFEWPSALFRK